MRTSHCATSDGDAAIAAISTLTRMNDLTATSDIPRRRASGYHPGTWNQEPGSSRFRVPGSWFVFGAGVLVGVNHERSNRTVSRWPRDRRDDTPTERAPFVCRLVRPRQADQPYRHGGYTRVDKSSHTPLDPRK